MYDQLNKIGKFSQKLNDNSLIRCPRCRQCWGVKKWNRICDELIMVCPGCGELFQEGTHFVSFYIDRQFESSSKKSFSSLKIGAIGKTKAIDNLIRKEET